MGDAKLAVFRLGPEARTKIMDSFSYLILGAIILSIIGKALRQHPEKTVVHNVDNLWTTLSVEVFTKILCPPNFFHQKAYAVVSKGRSRAWKTYTRNF